MRGFLRVAKLCGHQLEHGVRERDDVRAAMAAVSQLPIDRLRNNPNASAVRRWSLRALCSNCPHLARAPCRLRASCRKQQNTGFQHSFYSGIYKEGLLLPHLNPKTSHPLKVRTRLRIWRASAYRPAHVTCREDRDFGWPADFPSAPFERLAQLLERARVKATGPRLGDTELPRHRVEGAAFEIEPANKDPLTRR